MWWNDRAQGSQKVRMQLTFALHSHQEEDVTPVAWMNEEN